MYCSRDCPYIDDNETRIFLLPNFLFLNSTNVMNKDMFIRLGDGDYNIRHFSENTVNRKFYVHSVTSLYLMVILWSMILQRVKSDTLPKHLLWAIFYRKDIRWNTPMQPYGKVTKEPFESGLRICWKQFLRYV